MSHHIVLSCPLVTDQGDDITPEPICKLPQPPPTLTCHLFAPSPKHKLGSHPLLQGTQLVPPLIGLRVKWTRLAMSGQTYWRLLPYMA